MYIYICIYSNRRSSLEMPLSCCPSRWSNPLKCFEGRVGFEKVLDKPEARLLAGCSPPKNSSLANPFRGGIRPPRSPLLVGLECP